MAIVSSQTIHQRSSLLQKMRVDFIPHGFGSFAFFITIIMHQRVTVEDLKKAFKSQLHEVLGRNGIVEIGMIDVRKHRLARLAALGYDQINVVLHYLRHAVAALWTNEVLHIGHVDVNRLTVVAR